MDYKQLWDGVLAEIELSVSKANFNTWFKDTYISEVDRGCVTLNVPNAFVKEWLATKYNNIILKALRKMEGSVKALDYNISKEPPKKNLGDTQVDKKKENSSSTLPLTEGINKESNLNPKYTFDSFVVGPFNELAHAAAQAVIQKPGIAYNPYFIYGNTGHGKTHLIQAIGNEIKRSYPNKNIYYVTSEKFTQDLINSIAQHKVNLFKEKYRRYDVIIMDDIQFLSNKEKTQEELFHIFNSLYENNKQIIFSSDQHPNYIPNLEDRLKSRFSAGMTIDIPAPDHESRSAILNSKAEKLGIDVQSEVLDHLASSIPGNIRELEGVLNSIMCQTQLKNRPLTLTEVKNLIKNSSKPKKLISTKEVIKIVSNFYNIDEQSIYDKTRRKDIIRPRQVVMYILREDFNISYPSIGQKIGGRDHTTVIHSCDKIKNELQVDNGLNQEINQLRALFG